MKRRRSGLVGIVGQMNADDFMHTKTFTRGCSSMQRDGSRQSVITCSKRSRAKTRAANGGGKQRRAKRGLRRDLQVFANDPGMTSGNSQQR
jgi:hypothetical protein